MSDLNIIADRRNTTIRIDDALSRAVLRRLGREYGEVRVTHEEWDLGFCDTCSYPEEGFAVWVDDEQVWPAAAIEAGMGGCIYGDDEGEVIADELHTWGAFFAWVSGEEGWDGRE